MKSLAPLFAMAVLLFALNPAYLKAETTIDPASIETAKSELLLITSAETSQSDLSIPEGELAMVSSAEAAKTAHANALLDRLNEINEMDMSAMNSSEKNDLRKEVRAIQKEQKQAGGIYISVGQLFSLYYSLFYYFNLSGTEDYRHSDTSDRYSYNHLYRIPVCNQGKGSGYWRNAVLQLLLTELND